VVSGATEREALVNALRDQREHVLRAVAGLPDGALRQPVLPSGWTCLGLVQHLALDVERFWFRAVLAGEAVDLCSGDEAWRVDTDTPASAVLDTYREEIRRADRVLDRLDLGAEPAWWPEEIFSDLPARDVRQTILAVLVETACHAGHLDAVRELLDGHQDLVLT
jgi:uncharacterized damage-inducible protein DinB